MHEDIQGKRFRENHSKGVVMGKSIMQTEKECYFSKTTTNLHKHHIFGGANRKHSEKWGCWVYLNAQFHNGNSPYAVHRHRETDLKLKRKCQQEFERRYGHEMFMKVFGKSYLEVEQ